VIVRVAHDTRAHGYLPVIVRVAHDTRVHGYLPVIVRVAHDTRAQRPDRMTVVQSRTAESPTLERWPD